MGKARGVKIKHRLAKALMQSSVQLGQELQDPDRNVLLPVVVAQLMGDGMLWVLPGWTGTAGEAVGCWLYANRGHIHAGL